MRVSPQSTTSLSAHVGFEFQGYQRRLSGAAISGSTGLLKRTQGDVLIVYDFDAATTCRS